MQNECFELQMLPEVGNISISVLASVSQSKTRALWQPVWGQRLLSFWCMHKAYYSWKVLLPTPPSLLLDEKISFLWWPYSSSEYLDTANRKLFLIESGPCSYSFYMNLSLFTKGQLNSHKSAKFITVCLPKYFLSFQLNVAFSSSFYLATA